jgi:hypothetical protein
MTAPLPAQARRDRLLIGAGLLYVLPGLLLLLISFTRSIFSDSPTLLSPVNRLGFALIALGLLLAPMTLEALRRLSPSWSAVLAERMARAARHPLWVWRAQWWCASVGALAFALLALAPEPLGAWLNAGSQDAPFNSLAFFGYVYLSGIIACAPLFLLLRLDRPR